MNDLIKYEQNLPEVYLSPDQIAKPVNRMEYIAFASQLAMRVASGIHVHTVLTLLTTVQQAELLKQACQPISPEVEAQYQKLTKHFMTLMEAIPQQVSAHLMAELQRVPSDLDKDGILAKVRKWLSS